MRLLGDCTREQLHSRGILKQASFFPHAAGFSDAPPACLLAPPLLLSLPQCGSTSSEPDLLIELDSKKLGRRPPSWVRGGLPLGVISWHELCCGQQYSWRARDPWPDIYARPAAGSASRQRHVQRSDRTLPGVSPLRPHVLWPTLGLQLVGRQWAPHGKLSRARAANRAARSRGPRHARREAGADAPPTLHAAAWSEVVSSLVGQAAWPCSRRSRAQHSTAPRRACPPRCIPTRAMLRSSVVLELAAPAGSRRLLMRA